MHRTHSSAGWFFHLGGLSWSEGATIISVDVLSCILCSDRNLTWHAFPYLAFWHGIAYASHIVHTFLVKSNKVRLHRYICLWGASERKLERSLKPNQKGTRKYQGERARHSATKEATPSISGWFINVIKRVRLSSYWVGRPAGGAVCEGQQDVHADSGQSSKMCSSSWTECQSQILSS